MIRSMTGFGRAQVAGDKALVSVEARSVNHRHLDIALKLPRLAALESNARRLIQERLERGRIDVSVSVTPVAGEASQQVLIDAPLARAYAEAGRAPYTRYGFGLFAIIFGLWQYRLARAGAARQASRVFVWSQIGWLLLLLAERGALG